MENNTAGIKSYIPYILVVLQFACIIIIILSGPSLPQNKILLTLEMFGIALGLWAILVQRIGNFNITPTNREEARFIKTGPYSIIRHPMYLAIIITLTPLIINYFTMFRISIALILIIILILKILVEEKQLLIHFSAYKSYMKKTWRLIPWIF